MNGLGRVVRRARQPGLDSVDGLPSSSGMFAADRHPLTIGKPMKLLHARLRLAIVILAWLAQALLPVVHAVGMSAPKAAGSVWCGERSSQAAAIAMLPPEVRQALSDEGAPADHLENCMLLCGLGAMPGTPVNASTTVVLRAAGLEPPAAPLVRPISRAQAPTPPAQAPPALG